jgi:hypothetical protein
VPVAGANPWRIKRRMGLFLPLWIAARIAAFNFISWAFTVASRIGQRHNAPKRPQFEMKSGDSRRSPNRALVHILHLHAGARAHSVQISQGALFHVECL